MAVLYSVRRLAYGAAFITLIAAPIGVLAGQAPSQTLADCGGVSMPILAEGTPVDNCPAPVAPPGASGGAPSQGLLTACSGIPGCLSNALYGPGRVLVPTPDTTVHQSQ